MTGRSSGGGDHSVRAVEQLLCRVDRRLSVCGADVGGRIDRCPAKFVEHDSGRLVGELPEHASERDRPRPTRRRSLSGTSLPPRPDAPWTSRSWAPVSAPLSDFSNRSASRAPRSNTTNAGHVDGGEHGHAHLDRQRDRCREHTAEHPRQLESGLVASTRPAEQRFGSSALEQPVERVAPERGRQPDHPRDHDQQRRSTRPSMPMAVKTAGARATARSVAPR